MISFKLGLRHASSAVPRTLYLQLSFFITTFFLLPFIRCKPHGPRVSRGPDGLSGDGDGREAEAVAEVLVEHAGRVDQRLVGLVPSVLLERARERPAEAVHGCVDLPAAGEDLGRRSVVGNLAVAQPLGVEVAAEGRDDRVELARGRELAVLEVVGVRELVQQGARGAGVDRDGVEKRGVNADCAMAAALAEAKGELGLVDARQLARRVARRELGNEAAVGVEVHVVVDLGVAAHAAYDSKDRSKGPLNPINTLHSLIEGFMEPFRGVSTKHLDAYLAWFEWCRTFMAAGSKAAEKTVARQLAHGSCRTRVREMFNVEPPYMDYWDAAA